MGETSGPIYEVTLDVEGVPAAEVDAWLDEHVNAMLGVPGFRDAVIFRSDDGEGEGARVRRVTQYLLESRRALDEYLDGPAVAMRRATEARFGNAAAASRRVLQAVGPGDRLVAAPERCRNCGTPLGGQYCSRCGQRARSRLISVWELVRDAFGDLFELDSRLWQTLIPLAFRPGRLTRDYLTGRRARFMPPFRTYLVLSVVFFLVAFFDPGRQFALLLDPPARQASVADVAPGLPAAGEKPGGVTVEFDAGGDAVTDCNLDDVDLGGTPDWLQQRLTPERLRTMCEKIRADSGREFLDKLLDNVPAALFVLLPLMALVLKMLYPLSRRYYVEHLLFVLHFHAFFFLILTLEVLWSRLVALARLPELAADLTVAAISIYIPVYLYRAMRRVYEQGRAITLLKYALLVFAYLVGFTFMLLIATFYTAFSI